MFFFWLCHCPRPSLMWISVSVRPLFFQVATYALARPCASVSYNVFEMLVSMFIRRAGTYERSTPFFQTATSTREQAVRIFSSGRITQPTISFIYLAPAYPRSSTGCSTYEMCLSPKCSGDIHAHKKLIHNVGICEPVALFKKLETLTLNIHF